MSEGFAKYKPSSRELPFQYSETSQRLDKQPLIISPCCRFIHMSHESRSKLNQCTFNTAALLPPILLHHQNLDHADEDVEEV